MSPVSGTSEITSVILSLGVILVFLLAAAYLARRWQAGGRIRGRGAPTAIRIVASQQVGWQSSLQIVEADGQRFLIAAGRSGITAIGRLPPPGPGFAELLDLPVPDARSGS